MDLPIVVGWLLVGWCGTVPRHWPPQPPDPNPWMRYIIGAVIGAVGGAIGGWVFGQLFSVDYAETASVLLTFAGAFVGGRLASDVGGLVMASRAG